MLLHATRHCPPWTSSFPAQKKVLIHLLISSSIQAGASATTIWCTALATTTELISMSLPSLFTSPLYHTGTHLVTWSISGCHSALVRGRSASYSPKYLIGKAARSHPRIMAVSSSSSCVPRISVVVIFLKLTCSPDATLKRLKMCFTTQSSPRTG
jgi:hypothetical protein